MAHSPGAAAVYLQTPSHMNLKLYTMAIMFCAVPLASMAQWVAELDIPTAPFDGGYSFTLGGKVYVGAGDALFAYDPVAGTWQTRTPFPGEGDDRGWASAFVIGSTAYVGLGITNGNIFRTDLHAYDAVTNSWTTKASFPGTARGGCATFVVNNKAYVCGGTSTGPTFSDVYSYDPVGNVWALVNTQLPTGTRGFATGFAIGSYGYVYGGYFGLGNETPALHRYDPITNTWLARTSFPGGGRQSAVGVVVDGKALVGMGHAGFTTGYSNFYRYDPVANAWSPAGSFPGGNRIVPVAASYNGVVYMGAGYDLNFSPNGDWWSNAGLVGIDEAADATTLRMAPMPATDVVTLSLARPDVGNVQLFDIAGSIVLSSSMAGDRIDLDISDLASGMYSVRFIGTSGSTYTSKLMKQ